MNEAWLDQWVQRPGTVLRHAVADVEKVKGGGNASLDDLKNYILRKGGGAWTLLETEGYYIVIKTAAPALVVRLGKPTLPSTREREQAAPIPQTGVNQETAVGTPLPLAALEMATIALGGATA